MSPRRSGAVALRWEGTADRVRTLVASLRPWAEALGAEGLGDAVARGPHQEPYTWKTYLWEELPEVARSG